jgi:hypothetical protein
MVTRATYVLTICALLAVGTMVHAKGSSGIVTLRGVVDQAVDSGDRVSLKFTGELSFEFFTAARDDATRKQIKLKFDVNKLHVEMLAFGEERGSTENPLLVSFANAAKHSLEASKTHEVVTIALFTPALTFDVNGVLKSAIGEVSQVLPESPAPPNTSLERTRER